MNGLFPISHFSSFFYLCLNLFSSIRSSSLVLFSSFFAVFLILIVLSFPYLFRLCFNFIYDLWFHCFAFSILSFEIVINMILQEKFCFQEGKLLEGTLLFSGMNLLTFFFFPSTLSLNPSLPQKFIYPLVRLSCSFNGVNLLSLEIPLFSLSISITFVLDLVSNLNLAFYYFTDWTLGWYDTLYWSIMRLHFYSLRWCFYSLLLKLLRKISKKCVNVHRKKKIGKEERQHGEV